MMKTDVKSILKQFWAAVEGYEGAISCRKTGTRNGLTYYTVVTDGNRFDAVVHDDDPNVVFYREEGVTRGAWKTTERFDAIDLDGVPVLPPDMRSPEDSPAFIAQAAGCSVATVYNRAKELGRLPTVEECQKRAQSGRPRKY